MISNSRDTNVASGNPVYQLQGPFILKRPIILRGDLEILEFSSLSWILVDSDCKIFQLRYIIHSIVWFFFPRVFNLCMSKAVCLTLI